MALIPYDPFTLFRRDTSWPLGNQWFDDDWFGARVATMPNLRVDVRESQQEVIVAAEIPGLEKKEDVQITVHENHLHLNGKIERNGETQSDNLHRAERYFGQFTRTIALPATVDEAGASATYKNGVLEICLPKQSKPNHRQIDVNFH